MWIWLSLSAGFVYALGNVTFGINCSQLGVYGAGFPGPITFILIAIYRFYTMCKTKQATGKWIDKANSNYWRISQNQERENPANLAAVNDDFVQA